MEVPYHDGIHGDAILTFDGTVLEFFTQGKSTSVARVHARMAYIKVDGPNRKGYYELNVSTSPRGLGGFQAYVHTDTWPWVDQLLQAVSAASGT